MHSRKDGDRIVSPEQLERLSKWSFRKPVIAVMGEFSSGKSSLMNLLLGRDVLPTQVTATRLPPIWLRHGKAAPFRVDLNGRKHDVDLDNPDSIPVSSTKFIRIYEETEVLTRYDLIDTPGISDPNIPFKNWMPCIGYANSVMWCTHATQAWRESERSTWSMLPARLRQTSILLVTRKDKIETERDQGKIDRRLERETSGLFDGRCFISLTKAARARDAGDKSAWSESGAEDFIENLEKIVEGISVQRSYDLARYRTEGEYAEAQVEDVAPAVEEALPSASVVRLTAAVSTKAESGDAQEEATEAAFATASGNEDQPETAVPVTETADTADEVKPVVQPDQFQSTDFSARATTTHPSAREKFNAPDLNDAGMSTDPADPVRTELAEIEAIWREVQRNHPMERVPTLVAEVNHLISLMTRLVDANARRPGDWLDRRNVSASVERAREGFEFQTRRS